MKTVVVFSKVDNDEGKKFIHHSRWNELSRKEYLIFSDKSDDRLVFLQDQQYEDDAIPVYLEEMKNSDVYFIYHTEANKNSQRKLVDKLGTVVEWSNYSHASGDEVYIQIASVMNSDRFEQEFNKLCDMISFPAIYESAAQVPTQLFLYSLNGEINDEEWSVLRSYAEDFLNKAEDKLPSNNEGTVDLGKLFPEIKPSDIDPKCLLAQVTEILQTIMRDIMQPIESTN